MEIVFALLLGLILGGAAVWSVVRARIDAARAEAHHSRELYEQAKTEIPNAVKAASSDASQSLVDAMVKPIAESLKNVDGKLETLEKARSLAQGQLSEHLRTVTAGQDQLRRETASLVTALRAPATRGRWGELQLKRVCEMAGLISTATSSSRARPTPTRAASGPT